MIFNDNYVEYHGISQLDGFQHGNMGISPLSPPQIEIECVRHCPGHWQKWRKKSENTAVYRKPEEKNYSSLGPVGFYFSIFFVGCFFPSISAATSKTGVDVA